MALNPRSHRPASARQPGSALGKLTLVLLAALLAAVIATAGQASAEDLTSAWPLALLADSTTDLQARTLFRRAGIDVVEQLRPLPIYRLRPPAGSDGDIALGWLRQQPLVRAVEADGEQRLTLIPNDRLYKAYQWNLRRIGMEEAWNLRPTAPEMVVAVMDSGVDLTHPDLRANLLLDQGYNFSNDTPDPQDDETHGTAVAGIIGAIGNNEQGLAGIAWKVKILPVKVLNSEGRGSNSTLAQAIIYGVEHGARIINISSTSGDFSASLARAVGYAQEQGALVVAAAGNSGDQENEVTYPAALAGVVAVGAVDVNDQVPGFSQRRWYVSVLAPGVDVPSLAWPGAGRGLQGSYSGTSIAAPHVSGVAALLWTLRPDLRSDQIASIVTTAADDLGRPGEPGFGTGVLNAARAVGLARLGVPPSPLITPTGGATGSPAPAPTPSTQPSLPARPTSLRWYFAEGSTNPPFDMWFAMENPNPEAVTLRFSFVSPDGVEQTYQQTIAPNARGTVHANAVIPTSEFATVIESSAPIYAERSMYFGHDGHSAPGVREPARTWYLAEGSTAAPFDTWVLLQNPGNVPANVRLTFMRESGETFEQMMMVPPRGRRSLYVNLLFTAAGFSTSVEADQPIVVERAMYFDGGNGGHATTAARDPSRTWYMADGTSKAGFDTWLLVQNPGDAPANTRVTFYTEDAMLVTQDLLVAPRSRASLLTNLVVPEATYGMRLTSDQPVVVERAVYFDGGRAGYDSAAVPMLAQEWHLPEGSTEGSFVEQVLLLNPGPVAATVELTLIRQDNAPVTTRRIVVGATQRVTIDVNALAPDIGVSVRVTSDRPIMAERTLYFANASGVGATNSPGLTP